MTAALDDAARLLARSGGPAAASATAIAEQLAEPLRVAIVGRVSAGKSTLVNAMLAQAVAPTGAGETTRLPCWFRHGRYSGAALRHPDGRRTPVPLVGGHLPDQLPPQLTSPDGHLEMTLPVPILSRTTIVDTPGIASVNDAVAARTAQLLSAATDAAAQQVEALVVVLTGPLRAEEAAAVESLTRAVPSAGAVPAVAALTRVDTLDRDPTAAFAAGAALAARLADDHPELFDSVVPVCGLMAATGACGSLTETDARNLAALARAWTPERRVFTLSDARIMTTTDAPVEVAARRRLIELLDLAGVRLCLTYLDEHPGAGAAALSDHLEVASGLSRLLDAVDRALAERADLLKAAVAVRALRRLGRADGVRPEVRGQIADLLDAEILRPIEINAALARQTASFTPLPPHLAHQVNDARRGRLPRVSGELAASQCAAWRSWAMTADGPGRSVADAMCLAWQTSAKGAP
jgi:hypothetical protein